MKVMWEVKAGSILIVRSFEKPCVEDMERIFEEAMKIVENDELTLIRKQIFVADSTEVSYLNEEIKKVMKASPSLEIRYFGAPSLPSELFK